MATIQTQDLQKSNTSTTQLQNWLIPFLATEWRSNPHHRYYWQRWVVTNGNNEDDSQHLHETMEADQKQVPPQFVRTFTCYRMATTNADNVRQNSMVCYWMVTTTPHSVKLEWWYGCFWRFAGNVSQIGTEDYVQWFGRRYSNKQDYNVGLHDENRIHSHIVMYIAMYVITIKYLNGSFW